VAANVFGVTNTVSPIFVLGSESVEKQRRVDELKASLIELGKRDLSLTAAMSGADSAVDKFCVDRAKLIKDMLRSPGANPYNNYDKAAFKSRVQRMVGNPNLAQFLLTEPDKDARRKQLTASPKQRLELVHYAFPDAAGLLNTVQAIAGQSVVSTVIESLRNDQTLAEWIHDGLRLHASPRESTCLFCDQPLPAERLRALQLHFSQSYEKLIGAISALKTKIDSLMAASKPSRPNKAELYEDLSSRYGTAEAAFISEVASVVAFLDKLLVVLEAKTKAMFDAIHVNVAAPSFDAGSLARINAIITEHNVASDQFSQRQKEAREALEADSLATDVAEYDRLTASVTVAKQRVEECQRAQTAAKEEIASLERDIVEHRRPAEELNADLYRYLGHGELQLSISENGYTIARNGVPAQALSEGESTAIALLYFLKSLEDRRVGDIGRAIVVLDDPVSSLDQNAMYAAFGYIRARTQSVGQLFVLAHNFTFFRAVREWFGHLRGADARAWAIYMLRVHHDGRRRCGGIYEIDPLLVKFESDYHYLYSCIHKWAHAVQQAPLEECYQYPSVARRVLETFLAFRAPGKPSLWARMQSVSPGFEEARRSRIYRFVQTHSHREVVGDADEDLTLLAEGREVLRDMLAFMRAADEEHCVRMDAVVTPPQAAEVG
jgi:wobble nucleotide-excising tRNase